MPDKFQEVLIVITASIIIFLVLTGIVVFIIIFYQKKRHQHVQRIMEMEKTYSEELLHTRLEIQEETFKTISQEIHDNIGQALSFVKLNINTVDVYNPEATKEKLLESKIQLSQTIQDLRDLAKSLNPDFITELGLTGAIEQQLQFMQKTGLYQTSLVVTGDEYKNQLQQELVIFRIVSKNVL